MYKFGSTAKLNLIYFVEWINKFFESLKSIVALNNYWGINLNMKVDVGRNNRYESNDIKTKEQSTYLIEELKIDNCTFYESNDGHS